SGSLVRTIVGLAIVLLVIYGVYWVLKQVKASREETAKGDGLMTVASLGLGPNRALHLVRAGHEVILVGVAEHAITPIRSYTEAEAIAAGLLDMPEIDTDGEVIEGEARELTTSTPSIRDFLPVLRPKAGATAAKPVTLQALLGQLKEKTVRS
ncbi:MAG: FliO/MopB family protein, partial [Solirubrobacteraceae bacterium]|nr:FliO/MopB family protein [Solirubrobacteraceae bacterium]